MADDRGGREAVPNAAPGQGGKKTSLSLGEAKAARAEPETQGERPWDKLPLPDDWPTSWPLAFPPNYFDPPSGKTGMIRNDVERAEAEGWRVLTVQRVPTPDLNRIVEQVRAWLAAEYPPEQPLSGGWEVSLTDEVGNVWLHVDARPQMPYERGEFPAEIQFAVLRSTGALHRVIAGEVQDPALEIPDG